MKAICDKVADFLGRDGIRYFSHLKGLHGTVSPVLCTKYGIPHPVHFREGMQIRNFLRGLPECKEWSDNDFDDRWCDVVEIVVGLGIHIRRALREHQM